MIPAADGATAEVFVYAARLGITIHAKTVSSNDWKVKSAVRCSRAGFVNNHL